MFNTYKRALSAAILYAVLPGLSGCAIYRNMRDTFNDVARGPDFAIGADSSTSIQSRTDAMSANLKAMLGMKQTDALNLFETIESPRATSVMLQGYGYIDDQCTIFFTNLLRVKRDRDTASKEFALMGAAAGTIIAIAGPGLAAAGIAAAATGLATGTTDNLADNVLYAMDPGEAHNLVVKAQQALANSPGADPIHAKDYIQAYSVISAYARICTPIGVEDLVKAEIAKAKPEETTKPKVDPVAEQNRKTALVWLDKTSTQIGLKASMTLDQAKALYLLFNLDGQNDPKIVAGVHKLLDKTEVDALVIDSTATPVVKLDATNIKQLVAGLAVANEYNGAIATGAESIRQDIAKPAPAPAAPAALAPAAPAVVAPAAPPQQPESGTETTAPPPDTSRPSMMLRVE